MVGKRSRLVAIDSTGYESGHTSRYYCERSGIRKHHFPKLTALCDTTSHLYLAGIVCRGPAPDDPQFGLVVVDAFGLMPFDALAADAGYDSEAHHRLVREGLGARTAIPPTRGRPGSRPPKGRYRRLMSQRFPKKTYGQRWQVESCFSQDKRRFGSAIQAQTHNARSRRLLLRLLVHNIAILLSCPLPTQPQTLSRPCFQQSRSDPFSG